VSEFGWIEIKRAKGGESSMHNWLGVNVRQFVGSIHVNLRRLVEKEKGAQREEEKVVLRRLTHEKRDRKVSFLCSRLYSLQGRGVSGHIGRAAIRPKPGYLARSGFWNGD